MIRPRDLLRVLLSVFVGPLVGGLYFFTAAGLYETFVAHAPVTLFSGADPNHYVGPLIFFSYFLGLIPALLTGIAASIIAHRTASRLRRIVYSTLAGACASTIFVGWVVLTGDTSVAPPPVFIAMAASGGGLAALVVVLIVERVVARRRHPAHAADPS